MSIKHSLLGIYLIEGFHAKQQVNWTQQINFYVVLFEGNVPFKVGWIFSALTEVQQDPVKVTAHSQLRNPEHRLSQNDQNTRKYMLS